MNIPVDLIEQVPEAFRVISANEEPYFFPSLLEKDDDPTFPLAFRIASQAIINLVGTLNRAQKATELARSHRNYRVGSIAVMYSLEQAKMAFLRGYNIKPKEGSQGDNFHAEQIALAKGRSLGLDKLAAISVIADPKDLDANAIQTPTLRPCRRCINMFKKAPEVEDRTLVLGSNLDLTVCELYNVAHLYNPFDNENNPDGIKRLVDFEFPLASLEDLDNFDHAIAPFVIANTLPSFLKT